MRHRRLAVSKGAFVLISAGGASRALAHVGELKALMYGRFRPRPGRVTMPDVCCDLIWVDGRVYLEGPQTRARRSLLVGRNVEVVNLDPLVARQWLRLPLSEIVDRRVRLDEVDKPRAAIVADIFGEGSAAHLVRANSGTAPATPALAAQESLRRGRSVAAAAAAAKLSQRQLQRNFPVWFGLSPKQYASILRFRRAIRLIRTGSTQVQAALEAGYIDQPHFTRDTRLLSGLTPSTLLPHVANLQDEIARIRED